MCCHSEVDSAFIEQLAQSTDGFSGADLVNLCREAGLLCLRDNIENSEVGKKHFLAAKCIIHPSLNG